MEYDKEYENVSQMNADYLKPGIGVHKITILEEPEETVFQDAEREVPQIKMRVKHNQKEKTWYITKGLTLKSLFGQLMALGKFKGKLKDETITLSVNTAKNKDGKTTNSYQVLEAIEALPQLGVLQEEQVQ